MIKEQSFILNTPSINDTQNSADSLNQDIEKEAFEEDAFQENFKE